MSRVVLDSEKGIFTNYMLGEVLTMQVSSATPCVVMFSGTLVNEGVTDRWVEIATCTLSAAGSSSKIVSTAFQRVKYEVVSGTADFVAAVSGEYNR